MAEEIFFNEPNVYVSNSRFIVGNKTYAMNNVTSVNIGCEPASRGGSVALFILAVACLFGSGWAVPLGGILIVLAVMSWFGGKAKYSVIVSTSAGENHALINTDGTYIQEIIDALNEAMVSRG